jgi:uncharacterized membrane protein YcaP (DUF421 family)
MPDWDAIFSPSISWLEIIVRGSLIYLAIFVLLRVMRRESSSINISDVLVLVLIADAAQNGMSGEYTSVPEALILVGTILVWTVVIDWVSYRLPPLTNFVHPPPIELVKDGKLNLTNMRRNYITREELMTFVREAGLEDISKVRAAFLEGNGDVSVIPAESSRV